MKVFQFYQNFLTYVIVRGEPPKAFAKFSSGIKIIDLFQQHSFTLQKLFMYFIMTNSCICLTINLFLNAKTFQEYSETSYAILTLGACVLVVRIFEVNEAHIFKLIDNIEDAVKMRTSILNNPRVNSVNFHSF